MRIRAYDATEEKRVPVSDFLDSKGMLLMRVENVLEVSNVADAA
jgi:hypothetical protein